MERRSVYEALIRDLGVINRNEVRSPYQWFYPEERIPDPDLITKEWFDAEYGGYNLRVPSVLQVATLEEKFGANVWDLEPEWEASLKGKLIAETFIEGKDGADLGPRLVYDEDDKQWKLLGR